MTGVMTNLWFPRITHRRWPKVRLLCVGGAGTGPSEFTGWSTELPGTVELWPAQLPGRERRIREAPATRISDLADDLAEQMWRFSDPSLPWALFGHSFGSLVVYEVAKRVLGVLPVCGLIVSSMAVPHQQVNRLPVRRSDDDTLLDWVRGAGGTESALLDDQRFASWLAEEMWRFSDPSLPWALFGHSFGSLVVYEVAKRIMGVLPMCGLIVSSMAVPHQQVNRLPVQRSDDHTLLNWVRGAGGTESALLDDPRFASWLAEDLRVTLRIRQDYSPKRPAPLPSPILALGGADDPDARPEDLAQWCEYTSKAFAYQQIGSGHFFLRDSRPDVVATVAAQLDEWTERAIAYR